ncbi:hypothetical protein NHP190003_13380 [Helicobacter sp. NHP19-003]|uniref:Uncharacterized protein n=1 Tax=Helicobacter gastrocanis TaxID=2849641 RepID=A0ABN6I393_9HELI|nr:hypothetical protein [Helicobacter sp. NHP19-003]BCZ18056.1 hypothetical protein NHP190003_13380 [Helicobacter sp. NHP19-003]
MGYKERLKLEFDLMKVLVVVFLTALFSATAYGFVHYDTLTRTQFVFFCCGLGFLIVGLCVLFTKAFSILRKMERLE